MSETDATSTLFAHPRATTLLLSGLLALAQAGTVAAGSGEVLPF